MVAFGSENGWELPIRIFLQKIRIRVTNLDLAPRKIQIRVTNNWEQKSGPLDKISLLNISAFAKLDGAELFGWSRKSSSSSSSSSGLTPHFQYAGTSILTSRGRCRVKMKRLDNNMHGIQTVFCWHLSIYSARVNKLQLGTESSVDTSPQYKINITGTGIY